VRRIVATLAVLALALGFTVAVAGSADASVSTPLNNQVLRGTVPISSTGGDDTSTLDHCSGSTSTRIQLLTPAGGNVSPVFDQTKSGSGSYSVNLVTQNYADGSYLVRVTEKDGKNGGFLGFGCDSNTRTFNIPVTIDNFVVLQYAGPTSAPQNTSVTVSATLTDPNLPSLVLPGRQLGFSLSGGATVNATTNSSGVATATLPISGPPRTATLTVAWAGTSFYPAKSTDLTFAVNRNDSVTTLQAPATVVHGQPTSFTAGVAAGNGTGTPGGTIQFTVDGTNFGSPVALSGGTATTPSTTSLSTGSHSVVAVYNGDGNFFASTSATKAQQVDKAGTTTALTAAPSPTVSGQAVTFTATVAVVAPGAGAPTGGIQFNVDGQPYGTAVPLTGDTAELTISNLQTGNHQVDATYNGDPDFASSSSATVTHGVDKADSNVALSTSDSTPVSGEPLTFTAAVTAVGPGAGTPTGTVQFAVDGNPIGGPVSLAGGTATSPSTTLTVGSHLVTADYSGDENFGGESDSLTQDVNQAATTTSVSTSPNPSVVGQPVTLRATVAAVAPATGTPSGWVQFVIDGGPTIIGVPLQANGETNPIILSALGPGSHTIVGHYLGDGEFVGSTDEVTQMVNKAATKTVVESSSPTSVFGQPVTFTATVSVLAPGSGAPSGTITFKDGATLLGTVPVSSATGEQASITTSSLSVAQHAIVATYSGDDGFLASNGSVTQTVQRAQTSTVVTSSNNPALTGQGTQFTAEVTPVAPGAGAPTGTVVFTVNGAQLGSPATVVNGVATTTAFASLSPGTYRIKATYSGDGNFVGSSSLLDQGMGQVVTKGQTSMTLASGPNPSSYGEPVTFTSTVSAVAPATGRPTGVVRVWEGSVLLGSTSLVPGSGTSSQATFVSSTLSPGPHQIRAEYVGNFNFEGQTAVTSQLVGQVSTVTGIESSANPSTFGDSVTLTAVVTPGSSSAGIPTGPVTFTEGSNTLGTANLATVGGRQQVSITVSGLSAGPHDITATYAGNAVFAASTSATFTQNVNRAAATIVAGVPDDDAVVSARLTGVGGAPLAGETVSFYSAPEDNQSTHLCDAVTDADGVASCDETVINLVLLGGPLSLDGGYDARFAGNADYLPAEDSGAQF
jgi:hypothetical protein